MRRIGAALSASSLLAVFALSGCTQVVDVGGYTFDSNPCGPRPPSCGAGGTQRAYLVVQFDVPRADGEGRRDGFDFDGTDERICRQADFTSPSGVTGIDNQLATAFESLEMLTMTNVAEQSRARYLEGMDLSLILMGNLDDPNQDDCVTFSYHSARVPRDVPMPYDLDADDDGEVDANRTFDYLPAVLSDDTACIIDGVLHARVGSGRLHVAGLEGDLVVDQTRAEIPLSETRIEGLMLGGGVRLDELAGFPPEVVEFLRGRADLSPSSRTANDCSSISFAAIMDAVPAVLGDPL